MQYLSPFTFSGEILSTPIDKKAIQLARKKLFAELELSGGSTILLHGNHFTKDDIIKYFEDLLKEDALAFHTTVGKDQVLLGFLEHARIGRREKFQGNPLYEDEPFIQWISPFFQHSFLTFVDACFLEPDEDGLSSLLGNRLLMTSADLEDCWSAVTRIIMDNISTLEHYHNQFENEYTPEEVPVALVSGLMGFNYIRMIQLLPKSRFAPLMDEYASCMVQAAVETFNKRKHYRSDAMTWVENAELLAVSEEMKTQIAQTRGQMSAIAGPAGRRTHDSSAGATMFLKFLIPALFIIIKVATCNSDSNNSYNFENVRFEYLKDTSRRKLFDSLIKNIKDSNLVTMPVLKPADTIPALDTTQFRFAPK